MDLKPGFIVIDKPKGLTSHDCVGRIRKVFNIKKVGHGGTLDPAVTGVLPIALGNATRLLKYLPEEKKYIGIIQLGVKTHTDDLQGEIIAKDVWPQLNRSTLEKYLNQFRGKIKQRPPQVSSVHIKGERAYKRALKGESFVIPVKEVTIHELTLKEWDQGSGEVKIKVHCSSGTYIRSLARDLGDLIGCGGALASLRRTEALGFDENQAIPLPIENDLEIKNSIFSLSPIKVLSHLYHFKISNKQEEVLWRTGSKLTIDADRLYSPSLKAIKKDASANKNILVISCEDQVEGIGIWDNCKELKPKVVFNAIG